MGRRIDCNTPFCAKGRCIPERRIDVRRFFTVLVVLIATAALLLWTFIHWESTAPERALRRMMNALQNTDISKAERYTTHGLGLDPSTRQAKKLYKAMYKNMRYAIAEVTIDGERATALLTVTMVDLDAILADASLETLSQSLSSRWWSRGGKFHAALRERVEADDAPHETSTVAVSLICIDGKWKVDTEKNSSLLKAVTGGLGPF